MMRATGPGRLRRRTAVEPLRVERRDVVLDDLVVRDRGGEDVRVAMIVRLRCRHSRHSRHTPTPTIREFRPHHP
jgi:hypothetical protein